MKFSDAAMVLGLANTAVALPHNITTTPIIFESANLNITMAPGPVIINDTDIDTDTNANTKRWDQNPPNPPPADVGPADPEVPANQPFPHSCRRQNNGFWYGWEVISPTDRISPGGDLADPGNGGFDLGKVCNRLWEYLDKASGCGALTYTSCQAIAPGAPGIHWEFTSTIFCSRKSVQWAWDLATESRLGAIDCYRKSDTD